MLHAIIFPYLSPEPRSPKQGCCICALVGCSQYPLCIHYFFQIILIWPMLFIFFISNDNKTHFFNFIAALNFFETYSLLKLDEAHNSLWYQETILVRCNWVLPPTPLLCSYPDYVSPPISSFCIPQFSNSPLVQPLCLLYNPQWFSWNLWWYFPLSLYILALSRLILLCFFFLL